MITRAWLLRSCIESHVASRYAAADGGILSVEHEESEGKQQSFRQDTLQTRYVMKV